MKRYFLLTVLLMVCLVKGYATDVSVRIFSTEPSSKMRFTAELGRYRVLDGDRNRLLELATGEDMVLSVKDGKIEVFRADTLFAETFNLIVEGTGLKAIFGLQNMAKNNTVKSFYDDHLDVSVEKTSLFLINHVDLENYVAGVVQSEVRGISDRTDFYKVQAIISRTYAICNLHRHSEEGFDLCDDVHCQAYRSRNNTPLILTATVQTAGEVIVDARDVLIMASFYSNSGGQTANSEDVWNAPVSYLRSVPDTFSLSGKNAYWEKEMPRSEWLNFLHKTYRYDIQNPVMRDSALSFAQLERKAFFAGGIPLKNIRRDLKLRSTFFSVQERGGTVILKGRGYGHGVGLSQEGVVRMMDLGYSVQEAIEHYYTGVSIKNLSELPAGSVGD